MSIIGEAVLTTSVELLLNKLVSSELLRFPGQEKIQAELKQWEKKLININSVLADAEEKQDMNPDVKAWLVDLQILAYDVEDILDEFATNLSLESKASTSKAKRFVVSLNPRSVKFNGEMRFKIKEITKRMQDITDQKNDLKLMANSEERPNKVREGRIPTTSLTEAHVYGREKDQDAIIELLLKEEGDEDGISIIPIVGIGGVGKTTLAQNVYNDVTVENHFDIKVWAYVSDDFDITKVTQAILQSIAPETRDSSDLNKLQVELKERVKGKKFLIVLDDIWNENPKKLESLLRPFRSNSPGGKIIVTTRSDNISSVLGTGPVYLLKVLSDDDCFSIFAHHSLGKEGFNVHPKYFKEIAEKIVKRCKGLPLAVKTLAGLLRNNTDYNYWEHVFNSKIWNLPTKEGDIMPALRLSYHYLPPYLKPCFAYCSLLPHNYQFQKEEITLLWMAQGLLQQKGSTEEQLEDLGDIYFWELQSRSFFQQSSSDSSRYVMHDLINDLSQWVAGEFYFRMEINILKSDNPKAVSKNLRHLSYIGDAYDGIQKFVAFYGVKGVANLTYNGGLYDGVKKLEAFNDLRQLRTFLPFTLPVDSEYCYLTGDILNILPKLRSLRILSLNGYHITRLSDAIGDLKHLRYLDLSNTAIDVLSKSVGRLHNLQTLKLRFCIYLKKFCEEMENLINLRYLNLEGTYDLEGMPSKIGKLTNLRTLTNFVVGNDTNCGLKELKWLKHLRGTLQISGLQNINDAMDAKEADLSGKKNLTKLVLQWHTDPRKEIIETEVLNMLQPDNGRLENLIIDGYGGTVFPTWLGNNSFSSLVHLTFRNCRNCTSLPSVGKLPSLKELVIHKMSGIKRVDKEFYGIGCPKPFPKLEILRFWEMHEWEEWISDEFGQDVERLPRLQELSIVGCHKLQGKLPKHLPLLKRLYIDGCEQLLVSVLSLPADCNIEIDGCKQVEHRDTTGLSSLNPLLFSDIASHMFLIERFRQELSEVEDVKIVGYNKEATSQQDVIVCLAKLPQALHSFSFLRSMCIAKCPGLVSFPEASLPPQLESMNILFCDALKYLPESWMDNTSLSCLSIDWCKSLTYLARNQLPPNLKQLMITGCKNLQTLMQEENDNLQSSMSDIAVFPFPTSSSIKSELPATLECIGIAYCPNLMSLSLSGNLPKALKHLRLYGLKIESLAKTFHGTCLETIEISYCSGLVSFPVGELPSMNLKRIRIQNCQKLEALTDNMHQLNHLQVTEPDCSRFVSFPAGGMPFTNLTELEIRNCKKIEVLPNCMQQLNLTVLVILNCQKLEVLPNCMQQLNHLQKIAIFDCSSLVSFPDEGLPSASLTELIIKRCKKLEALPNRMDNLTSLQNLEIENCPDIKSFPPEDGLPTNLTSLVIRKPKIFKPLSKWGLHRLTSLSNLHIEGCPNEVSFPPEEIGILLPTSLILLEVKDFPNLKLLSSAIQDLSSLMALKLSNCPKLKSFPKKGLPISLLGLWIKQCPLLEQKCKKSRGKYWPLIAHIPDVEIKNGEEDDEEEEVD